MTRTYRSCPVNRRFDGLTCTYNPYATYYAEEFDSFSSQKLRRLLVRGRSRGARGTRMLHHDGESCLARDGCSCCVEGAWRAWRYVRQYNRVALRKGWEPMQPDWRNGRIAAWGALPGEG